MGDKISSSIVAQSANVPTLPWSGSDLQIDCSSRKADQLLVVPDEVYRRGCVYDVEEAIASAKKIGFPVMIKASEGTGNSPLLFGKEKKKGTVSRPPRCILATSVGGGGKGIRMAQNEGEFPSLFRQVQTEVPGSPIFIMKLARDARHLEVQVLCDEYGNSMSLFGRDCSVQRRHQKVSVLDAAQRRRLET